MIRPTEAEFEELKRQRALNIEKIVRDVHERMGWPLTELHAHVAGFRDDLGQTPAKANAYVKAIAALYAWGRERGFAVTNPADGISKLKLGQYRPWPQWAWRISQKHFRPELRLACGLALYTGQRLGDVLAMKLGDIRKGAITVRQAKTGKTLQIPLHRDALPLIEQLKRAAAP